MKINIQKKSQHTIQFSILLDSSDKIFIYHKGDYVFMKKNTFDVKLISTVDISSIECRDVLILLLCILFEPFVGHVLELNCSVATNLQKKFPFLKGSSVHREFKKWGMGTVSSSYSRHHLVIPLSMYNERLLLEPSSFVTKDLALKHIVYMQFPQQSNFIDKSFLYSYFNTLCSNHHNKIYIYETNIDQMFSSSVYFESIHPFITLLLYYAISPFKKYMIFFMDLINHEMMSLLKDMLDIEGKLHFIDVDAWIEHCKRNRLYFCFCDPSRYCNECVFYKSQFQPSPCFTPSPFHHHIILKKK